MNRARAIAFLRASYWIGAVFDALVVIPLLAPKVASAIFGLRNFDPGSDYRYAMYVAASLMLGWVSLLVWADRKPVERRGVLLLTIVPVIAGLMIAGIYAVRSDFIPAEKMLPTWIMQAILVVLFGFSYLNAGKLDG